MSYYTSKLINCTFDEAIMRVTETLKAEGFGVISEIRMHEKLKEKLGVNFKNYTILGACNPAFAYKALQVEDKIGTMLPCNVLVIEQEPGIIEIAAVDPIASMQAIINPELGDVAMQVSQKIKSAVMNLKIT
jgi:uncharacterized protein (DUF302 family)